jgi:hypothetical protein
MSTIEQAVRGVPGAEEGDISAILIALSAKRFTGDKPAVGPFQQLGGDKLAKFGLDEWQVAIVESAQKAAGERCLLRPMQSPCGRCTGGGSFCSPAAPCDPSPIVSLSALLPTCPS